MPLLFLIWGTRHYGRVLGHAGHYAITRFGHLWFIPLFPLGSIWVTHERDGQRFGHDIELHARSIAAGYLRVWGPLLAILALVIAGGAGLVLAVPWLLLAAWSWTWWSPRGERERRRAAWHRAAFGTACDPLVMTRPVAGSMYALADARFRAVSAGRSPDDVARLGATSPAQAIAAYALLRTTAAVERGAAARTARATGERVLDAHRDLRLDEVGGPYRRAA